MVGLTGPVGTEPPGRSDFNAIDPRKASQVTEGKIDMPYDENGEWYPQEEEQETEEERQRRLNFESMRVQDQNLGLMVPQQEYEPQPDYPDRAPMQFEEPQNWPQPTQVRGVDPQVDNLYLHAGEQGTFENDQPSPYDASGEQGAFSQPGPFVGPPEPEPPPPSPYSGGNLIEGFREFRGAYEVPPRAPYVDVPVARTSPAGTFQPPQRGGLFRNPNPNAQLLPPGEAQIQSAERRLQGMILRPEEQDAFNRMNVAEMDTRSQLNQGMIDGPTAAATLARINEMRGQYAQRVEGIPRTERELTNAIQRAQAASATAMARSNAEHYAQGLPGRTQTLQDGTQIIDNGPGHPPTIIPSRRQDIAEAREIRAHERREARSDRVQEGMRRETEAFRSDPSHQGQSHWSDTPEREAAELRRRLNIRELAENPNAPTPTPTPPPIVLDEDEILSEHRQRLSTIPASRVEAVQRIFSGAGESPIHPRWMSQHGTQIGELRDIIATAARENRTLRLGEAARYQRIQAELSQANPQVGRLFQLRTPSAEQGSFDVPASRLDAIREEGQLLYNDRSSWYQRIGTGQGLRLGELLDILRKPSDEGRQMTPEETHLYLRSWRALLDVNPAWAQRMRLHR